MMLTDPVRACPLALVALLLGLTLLGAESTSGGSPLPDASEAAALGDEFDAPTGRWREGPVRYLLTRDENRAYRGLKRATPDERKRFIDQFWSRRDPDPARPGNFYRELFYRRVAEANHLFNDAPVPGWKTDRGKTHILLGPPDEVERITTGRSDRFVIIWTYRSMKTIEGLGLNPSIRFIRDRSGEYRMSSNIRLLFQETTMGLAFQAQAMQLSALPHARDASSVAGAFPENDPILASADSAITTRRDFYRSTRGGTLVVLTVGLRPDRLAGDQSGAEAGEESGADDDPGPAPGGAGSRSGGRAGDPERRFVVEAVLLDPGAADAGYSVEGEEGRLAAAHDGKDARGDRPIFQGGAVVPPGGYTARYRVLDRRSGAERIFREPVEVPAFSPRALSISSVTLARRVERLPLAAGEYVAPYILRDRRVVRHPDHLLSVGDDLSFFYETYGLMLDPIGGSPDFDVEYRFFIAGTGENEDEGGFSPLGHPIRLVRRSRPAQEFSLSLNGWSRGLYRLMVTVDDTLAGQTVTREVTFRVD